MIIDFNQVLECIKNLRNVQLLDEHNKNPNYIFFKKDTTRYVLGKPERLDKDIKDDFSLSLIVRPSILKNRNLSYLEILELVNEVNQRSTNTCKVSYKKDANSFLIETTHIVMIQNLTAYENYLKENLDSYLTITILGMLILLLEAQSEIEEAILTIHNNKGSENEENK